MNLETSGLTPIKNVNLSLVCSPVMECHSINPVVPNIDSHTISSDYNLLASVPTPGQDEETEELVKSNDAINKVDSSCKIMDVVRNYPDLPGAPPQKGHILRNGLAGLDLYPEKVVAYSHVPSCMFDIKSPNAERSPRTYPENSKKQRVKRIIEKAWKSKRRLEGACSERLQI